MSREAESYEKLGVFYLGRRFDPEARRATATQSAAAPAARSAADEPYLYDARDLTTHAVCVGMTGSGKTGLCIGLLEEAALDGIPAIAIDPKGDLGNLLLAFPALEPADFRPWIDESDAARRGRTPDEHAAATAELWREGLADWHEDGARVARFRDAVDAAIYTPGSDAGLPLALLRSLRAPPPELRSDEDALRERVMAAVSGLLALLGIDADPIRSREHILISHVLDRAWRDGRDLELASLIHEIQKPPVQRIGVLELETFFPAAERLALAMQLNNLLGSPGFAAWMRGEPLDVARLLHTPDGRPRLSILSIAHLSEPERMFFVTLLLNEVVAWMRTQPGTQSLRAILYMDEVFGYFPPTANPPSKTPMLTLLKQARAYGLGVVLATQNPVDLDYKGLSNAGTWFLGRLQTERDKARVIEGLEGAAAGARFDRAQIEQLLAGLEPRTFLVNNVHDDEPTLMQTRWTLSYLRGPLARPEIARLMAARKAQAAAAPTTPASTPASAPRAEAHASAPARAADASARPVLPAEIQEAFLAPAAPLPPGTEILYRPALLGVADLHYADAKAGVDVWERAALLALLAPLAGGDGPDWAGARALANVPALHDAPAPGARFGELPTEALRAKSYATWSRQLASYLARERPLRLWQSSRAKLVSRPGESEGEFRVRLRERLREERDLAREKLRERHAPRVAQLEARIRRAEARVERERDQYDQQKLQAAISVGTTVLGALFGRKLRSLGNLGRATTAARGAGRAGREREDVAHAQDEVEALRGELAALDAELDASLGELRDAGGDEALACEALPIAPRKTDLAGAQVRLVWAPWVANPEGTPEPVF